MYDQVEESKYIDIYNHVITTQYFVSQIYDNIYKQKSLNRPIGYGITCELSGKKILQKNLLVLIFGHFACMSGNLMAAAQWWSTRPSKKSSSRDFCLNVGLCTKIMILFHHFAPPWPPLWTGHQGFADWFLMISLWNVTTVYLQFNNVQQSNI